MATPCPQGIAFWHRTLCKKNQLPALCLGQQAAAAAAKKGKLNHSLAGTPNTLNQVLVRAEPALGPHHGFDLQDVVHLVATL